MARMGNWEIELEMEKISGMFWFHKKKVQSFVTS